MILVGHDPTPSPTLIAVKSSWTSGRSVHTLTLDATMNVYRCSNCGAFNRVSSNRVADRPICGRCKAHLDTSGTPQPVDGDALASAIQSSPVPVLVDFWAPWCGPCRMAAPLLDAAARAQAGRLVVLKLNTDDDPGPGRKHRVSGIPAFVVFKDGREIDRQVGLPPQSVFSAWVSRQAA